MRFINTGINNGKNLSYSFIYPITVAAPSEAWTVFVRSNTGIAGSNPTQDMDVCVCVYSVFVLSCV
jgi:broad specificity polyphosphatase/5'/3'-nucleotidase SurE